MPFRVALLCPDRPGLPSITLPVTKAIDPDGHTSLSFYDGDGNLTKAVDADGHTSLSFYDGDDNLTEAIDADGNTTLQLYDNAGNVTETIDPDGNVTKQLYDRDGNVTATVDGDGATTQQFYDGDGNVTKAIDPDGHTSLSFYDGDGNVTKSIDPDGNTTQSQYDPDGNLTATIDARGYTTRQLYDADGNLTGTVNADGATSLSFYDGDGNLTATGDGDGHFSGDQYDADGRPTETIDADGHSAFTFYDGDGNVTKSIDADGNTTLASYDPDGNVTETTDGDGNVSKTAYDPAGNVTLSVDADGNTTLNSYDADNQLTKSVNGDGQTTLNSYDADGDVVQVIDILGRTSTNFYDGDGNVTKSVDGDGYSTLNFYDGDGNVTKSVDDDGYTTLTGYDGDGNVTKSVDGDGNTTLTAYDSDGNVLKSVDGDGQTTQYAYDAAGNQMQVIDPDGNTTTMAYDGAGQLTSQTDPLGNVTHYAYDADGNQTLLTLPSGASITSSYDNDDQLIEDTSYDASGTEQNFDFYLRDADGNETYAENINGAYTMSYDHAGRVTEVVDPAGMTLTYGYDGDGNQTTVTDSFGGVQTSTYNLEDQLVSRSYDGEGQTLRIDFTYNDEGQIATESRYSDLAGLDLVAQTTNDYDGDGNATMIDTANAAGTTVDVFQYIYDAAGNVTQEVVNGGITNNYTYDADNQLAGANTTAYSYDANGNPTNTGEVVGADNQLLSDGTNTYTYDQQGNEVSKSNATMTWTYGYEDKNEMISAEETTTSTGAVLAQNTYKYDAFGNLIETDAYTPATGTIVTKYALDGWNPANPGGMGNENFNVAAVLNGSGQMVTRNIFGDQVDQTLARVDTANASDPAGTYWTLTDRLGSVSDVVDNTGTVQDRISYDAYGNITSETNASYRGIYAWTGQELDVTTGLQYNRARWYDASTARWISQDPMGFDAGDSNLYRYVNNDPTAETDPSGLQEQGRQEQLIQGVPVKKVDDVSGPDVTEWFAKELVTQIEFRQKAIKLADEKGGGAAPLANLAGFYIQAKYAMSDKWMEFGSPGSGKGVNTVVLAGIIMRKNQLGNIEFQVVGSLLPPTFPFNTPAKVAEKGYSIGPTYDKKHFHRDTYKDFQGLNRAENLAAFGVGDEIARRIAQLNSWKTKKEVSTNQVKTIIEALFQDEPEMKNVVNRYSNILAAALKTKTVTIGLDALTTVPNFGGFNTQGLAPSKVPAYQGQTGIEYHDTILRPEYHKFEAWRKGQMVNILDFDQWLQFYFENYTLPNGGSRPVWRWIVG